MGGAGGQAAAAGGAAGVAVGAELGLPQAHHIGCAHRTLQLLHQQACHTCLLNHPLAHFS